MSAVAVSPLCVCGSIGAPPELRQCPVDRHLWRGDKRLTSVSKVLSLWPQEPCSSCGWPIYSEHLAGCRVKAAIDNANRRGKEVDALFTCYVNDGRVRIPAGTGQDSCALFLKLKAWFDAQSFTDARCQVLLGDMDYGGVADLVADGTLYDVKCTYELRPSYAIQVGGYLDIKASMHNARYVTDHGVLEGALLHVAERHAGIRVVSVSHGESIDDWRTLKAAYEVVQRRNGK